MKKRQKPLTDEQWESVGPLLPEAKQLRDRRSRPPARNPSCLA